MSGLTDKNILHPGLEEYLERVEKERESFSFIEVNFTVDMRIAESRYKEDFKGNVGGIKDVRLSFQQWLAYKKYEASKFYVMHSDYYLGF